MIKAIICDTDGMLVRSEMFSVHLKNTYGIEKERTDAFFSGPFQDCLIGKADLKEVITPHLPQWGWKKSVDQLLAEWFAFEHKLDDALIEYLSELRTRGLKLYLLTNQEKYRTEYLLKQMGFEKIFDQVFSSAHIGHKKPDKEVFAAVMNQLPEIAPKEVIFWDDSQKNIDGALAYGIKAQLYTTFEDFRTKMEAALNSR